MNRLPFALLLVLALPVAAPAKDAFKNLPGVKDPAEEKQVELDMDCSSRIVQPWPAQQLPGRNGLSYRAYSCEEGRVTVGSNRPPNLIEYRKFKQYYQAK